jgi:trigger factor
MKHELKKLEKSEAEIIITVAPNEYADQLKSAAIRLSERSVVKGFRPGKASYETIKSQFGEQKILEEALQEIVQKNFFEAIKTEKLDTIGSPEIAVEKLAPNNDIVFKAKVALLPKIKLANLDKIKVDAKKIEINDSDIDKVVKDLQKMKKKEVLKNGTAEKQDKIIVDLDMFIDNVAIEGGQAKGHQVYLDEKHYIPGFAEKLIGLKKDDEKEFNLKFPKEHYQKNLAGKNIDIKVKAKDVYSLELPEINDDFAKNFGQNDLKTLKKLLRENLTHEAEQKENQRIESGILEQLIEKSDFEEIPTVLITSEKQKMFHELKHDLEHRGIEMEKYLADIKKTEDEIFRDFEEGAQKRVKAALISRQVAIDNDIKVEKGDLEKEIEHIKASYGHDPKIEENLKQPEILDMVAVTVQNRKVIEWLKHKIIGKTDSEHHCEHC